MAAFHNVKHRQSIAAFASILLFTASGFAASDKQPAKIDDQKNKLEATQLQIQAAEHNRQQTEAALREAKAENAKLQQVILDKAANIDRVERVILKQQKDIATLKKEEAQQHEKLTKQRSHMGRLVSAAWSLQQRPQLAAWMLPEQTRERALTARSLQVTSVSLKNDMQALNNALQRQELLQQNIVQQRADNEATIAGLEKERAGLLKDLEQRQKLVLDIQAQQSQHMEKIATLTRNAADMQQLIMTLEAQRSQALEARYADITPVEKPLYRYTPTPLGRNDRLTAPAETPRAASFTQAKGALPLPANGTITGQYGAKRGMNDRLKGLEIRTLAGATVTAPYEGEILFTGNFLDYGKMVILRHNRDYHTLVAGLSRIDVTRGQFLLDGEPIGAMGNEDNQRTLYLELRRSSQAIDPKPWFATTKLDYAKH